MPDSFEPDHYLRQLADGSQYLDLKWKLVWLRTAHPNARIETQIVAGDDDIVLCRAHIELPDGGSATGHGSAMRGDGEFYFETAEDRALGRALNRLGYGTEFEPEDDFDIEPSMLPPVELITARTLKDREEERSEQESETDEEEDVPTDSADQSESNDSESPSDAADVSWSKFWVWAKPRGYKSAAHLSELLDVDVLSLTPLEVRRLITNYELDHPPGGQDY